MRHHLARDFSKLYILDLGGNVRQNLKLSGTTHNVFGIQLGVSISLLVKRRDSNTSGEVLHARMPEYWKRAQKYDQLDRWGIRSSVDWKPMTGSPREGWTAVVQSATEELVQLLGDSSASESIFQEASLGISTNRDRWVTNFQRSALIAQVAPAIDNSIRSSVGARLYEARTSRYEQRRLF